jgi:hypothetical protein
MSASKLYRQENDAMSEAGRPPIPRGEPEGETASQQEAFALSLLPRPTGKGVVVE